ncbi:MAG TPA: phosphatase domain-containing protein [Pedobacter sp.]|uniref:App1 family protein n=1 Tax=Pedobacter sp. TaxID=1411316 RepID=UPI002CFBBC9A|nr:phosphatase domain-containing protein [Pedobacter sp.]HMI04112.1 phosphatase domain-containing protein [Pedobacter sp.]
MNKSVTVKVYHGYGHTHNLVVYGHVFRYKAKTKQTFSNNLFVNIVHLLRLFLLKPYPFVKVRLTFGEQEVYQKTEYDGFFKFEWAAYKNVDAGWHGVKVEALDKHGVVMALGQGQIYVPHITQYAFISDIDDTIMVSHSATIRRRLRELFIKNPRTRKTFKDAYTHYNLLAFSHTETDQPNPFFYVSSSEWNLYDYLVETFRYNKLPEGAFLLNQIKRWKDLVKTGKTGHEGKLMRVMRILDAFPNQRFVFFGDNSQRDPAIYTTIAEKYPKNIEAVYIRNVRADRKASALEYLKRISAKGIKTCLFSSSAEAIAHSRKTGLITPL